MTSMRTTTPISEPERHQNSQAESPVDAQQRGSLVESPARNHQGKDMAETMTHPIETDRELLEMAAKAAGIDYRPKYELAKTGLGWEAWNPLTDDGDAQVRAALLALPIAGYAVSLPGKDPDHALFLDRERAQQQATKAHGLVFELVTRPVLEQPLGEL